MSGFLHLEGPYVVQHLKGGRNALDELVLLIKSDPRHTDFTVVTEGDFPLRQLPDGQISIVYSEQLSLAILVGVEEGKTRIKSADAMELVEFVISNSDRL